jgi:hypothetical protein
MKYITEPIVRTEGLLLDAPDRPVRGQLPGPITLVSDGHLDG